MKLAAVSPGDAGFTLIEALIAVVLMGVIVSALATVTAQWLPGWDRGVGRLQRVKALADGLDRLSADIAAAEIVSAGGSNAPPLFDGGELSVIFVRDILNPNATASLEIVRIAEIADERGPVLVRSSAPFTPASANTGGADATMFTNPVPMIRAPYTVAFSYAGPDRVWHDTWHGQNVLPRAVRLRVRDLATSAILAISTTALIHSEVRATCVTGNSDAQCPELAGGRVSSADANGALFGMP